MKKRTNVEKIAEFNRHSQYIRDASSSNIMVERIAYLRNERMKTAIKIVVPQPGNTFPASEFKGRKRVPNGVTIPGS